MMVDANYHLYVDQNIQSVDVWEGLYRAPPATAGPLSMPIPSWVRLLPRPRVFEVGPIFRSEKSFTHRLQGSRWTWWYLLGFGHDSALSVDRAEGSLLLCLLESDVSSTGPPNIIFHGPDMLWARSARHMTEFTGLDIEMTFKDHYHEAGCPFLRA